jgi:hypothetical protein
LLASGVLAALAAGTKFTGLILIPVFAAAWLQARPRPRIPLGRGLVCLVLTPVFVILLLYGFDTRSVAQDPILAGRVHGVLANIPIPGYYFFRGFQLLYRLGHGGHLTSFLGEIRLHSTPLYFPLAFLVKMPIATLILCAWTAILLVSRRVPLKGGLVSLLIAPGLLLLMALTSPLDIGFRHIIPILPFVFIFCAAVVVSGAGRGRAIATAALIVLLAAESLPHAPNFIPFFNVAAGGPRAGHRYLLDSNVDWGQDLNRLADWAAAHHPRRLCLAYFGTADVGAYGIDAVSIDRESAAAAAGCDAAAVSQELMYGVPGDRFRALRLRPPDAMAGMLYLYRLR